MSLDSALCNKSCIESTGDGVLAFGMGTVNEFLVAGRDTATGLFPTDIEVAPAGGGTITDDDTDVALDCVSLGSGDEAPAAANAAKHGAESAESMGANPDAKGDDDAIDAEFEVKK